MGRPQSLPRWHAGGKTGVSDRQDMLSMILMLMFGPPIIFCLWMSLHPTTVYWMGSSGYLGALMSAIWILLGQHMLAKMWLTRRTVMFFVFILPSFVLLYVAKDHKLSALETYSQLELHDCDSFGGKRRLQKAWDSAAALHAECVDYQVNATGAPWQELAAITQVNRCPGYSEAHIQWAREWDYLERLEEREDCSGWCDRAPPLWIVQPATPRRLLFTRDSCSAVVASLLKAKVFRTSEMILAYCFVLMALLWILVGCMAS